jgi:nitrate reductase NapE component
MKKILLPRHTIFNKLKSSKKSSKPIKYVFLTILLIIVLAIPFIINYVYLIGFRNKIPPNTCFSASDLLSFYGVIVSGLITVCTVVITLNHNHKEYIQQIKYQMSREKRPYFVLDHVCLYDFSHKVDFENHINTKIPCDRIELSKDRNTENDVNIFIVMQNVGYGIAFSTSYTVYRKTRKQSTISQIEWKRENVPEWPHNNVYPIKLNVTQFFNEIKNFKQFIHIDDSKIRKQISPNTFTGKIKCYYSNIAGVDFEQELWVEFYITKNREISFNITPKTSQKMIS